MENVTVNERVARHSERIHTLEKASADHEARLRPLETFHAKVMGMAFLGSILGGLLAKVLIK